MENSDKQEFARVLMGIAAIRRFDLTPEAIDLWWLSMQDWSIDDFKAGAGVVVRTSEFMPSPYDFEKLRRAGQPTVGEAWAEAVASCTSWRGGVTTAGGRIDRAVRAVGGYRSIAMADIETALPHIERRFKEAYEELSDVEETRQALPNFCSVPRLPETIQTKSPLDNAVLKLLRQHEGSSESDGSGGFRPII